MRRDIVYGLAGAAALAATAGGAMMTLAEGFSSENWKAAAATTGANNPRSRMVSELKTRLKPGMTRGEVLDLLGKPDKDAGGFLTYDIGMSAYGVDYEYFVIEIDRRDLVTGFRIQRG